MTGESEDMPSANTGKMIDITWALPDGGLVRQHANALEGWLSPWDGIARDWRGKWWGFTRRQPNPPRYPGPFVTVVFEDHVFQLGRGGFKAHFTVVAEDHRARHAP